MMKKNCELCQGLARIYCESDQAILCWTCDYKVHTANFLVARHSRTLLCHVCQSPTPWTASGTKLGPTVSVCSNCVRNCNGERILGGNEIEGIDAVIESDDGNDEGGETSSDEDEEEDDDDEEENDIGDNQIVPWTPTSPPPSSSSSNSDGESYSSSSSLRDRRKRTLGNALDLSSNQANRCCASRRRNFNIPPETETELPAVACGGGRGRCERNLKRRRLNSSRVGFLSPNSVAIVESVKRIHREEIRSSAAIAEFCKLSEHASAVDCDLSVCSQPQD